MSTAPSQMPKASVRVTGTRPRLATPQAKPSAAVWLDRLIAQCSAADLAHLSRFLNWRV